ncbi:MAG: LysR family transcriptional regulator [Bacteroidetes bacterium]|nr:LysR family transcriptional regulator [Bacteroidota bacterium]
MNLQQLEYIVSVDVHRQFIAAAEANHVTQATLSMMVKKLEEELGVQLFDRSRQPVRPTPAGERVIARAKEILRGVQRLRESVAEEQHGLSGELRLGIIPTLAPYLLPLFIAPFLERYPEVRLSVSEHTTEELVRRLRDDSLDAGILATPLKASGITEHPLFYEPFVVYASSVEQWPRKRYLLSEDIDVERLWLLEEGHCLRSQVVNLCALKRREKELHRLDLEAGSIETLKKIVETNRGITILPELAVKDLSAQQRRNIRRFQAPVPVREVSLVTAHHFSRTRLVQALCDEVMRSVPAAMRSKERTRKIPVQVRERNGRGANAL